ncbi:hypothetical protein BDF19DRAFT_455962 [Syncephalis fuscata]|nr:hypothetical protein BDF19DRAFT_455962 [Syncephalis fuscata]
MDSTERPTTTTTTAAADGNTYYCHVCSTEIQPLFVPGPTCPVCHNEFVEQVSIFYATAPPAPTIPAAPRASTTSTVPRSLNMADILRDAEQTLLNQGYDLNFNYYGNTGKTLNEHFNNNSLIDTHSTDFSQFDTPELNNLLNRVNASTSFEETMAEVDRFVGGRIRQSETENAQNDTNNTNTANTANTSFLGRMWNMGSSFVSHLSNMRSDTGTTEPVNSAPEEPSTDNSRTPWNGIYTGAFAYSSSNNGSSGPTWQFTPMGPTFTASGNTTTSGTGQNEGQRSTQSFTEMFGDMSALMESMMRNADISQGHARTSAAMDDIVTNIMNQMGTNPHAQTGVTDEVIDQLPVNIIKDVSNYTDGMPDCAVCKDEFACGDEARQLPCRHQYHDDCIRPWLKQSSTCPVCRADMASTATATATTDEPAATGSPYGSHLSQEPLD